MSDLLAPFWSELAARYRLERLIGRGGMGSVHLAYELKHDRYVAVKVLLPELCNSVNSQRFLRELKIAASLQHPHIVPVYDSGEAAGMLYYVMPFVAGHTVRERLLREVQLPVDEAIRITREVASALAYAHHQGIIHRDIKPENILLSEGYAVVADFGIARALSYAGSGLTGGLALGTPPYMSPEQLGPEDRLDGRSDLYSLGCVLYEMLAGQPPFTGSSAHGVLARHAADPVPSVRTVRATVPVTVEQAVFRALEKVPADRFSSGEDFIRALGSTTATPEPPIPTSSGVRRRSSFFAELQRRRVYQAAILYASFAFAVMQVAPTLIGAFGLATWIADASVIGVLLGFPVTLVVSWSYDLTLRGFQRTVALPGAEAATRRNARRRLSTGWLLAGVVSLGAIAALTWAGILNRPRVVAVLPCSGTAVSAEAAYQYDVLTENLIGVLSQLSALSVKPRATVDPYKNSVRSALAIGKDLRADVVLTCRVREVDITLQAIETRNGARIWLKSFERRSGEIDQEAIALDAADNLDVRLTSQDSASLKLYQLAQKARKYRDERTAKGLETAVDLYKAALAQDPTFAVAQAGLAISYALMPYYGGKPAAKAYPLAERHANEALKLDANLPDAHAALGLFLRDYKYDWQGAEDEFRRATTGVLSPSALQWYAELMTMFGRFDRAESLILRAELEDPVSLPIRAVHGWILMCANRSDDAKRQLQETFKRSPQHPLPHWFLGQLYVQERKYDSALVRLREASRLSPGASNFLADLASAYALGGYRSTALALLDSLQRIGESGTAVSPYEWAVVHAGLGDREVAIDKLEAAKAERSWQLTNLRIDPMLAPLRTHLRYQRLVASLNFPSN